MVVIAVPAAETQNPPARPNNRRVTGPLLAVLIVAAVFVIAACMGACGTSRAPAYPIPDEDYSHLGLSEAEAATLLSLERVDDYPLYTMRNYAEYDYAEYALGQPVTSGSTLQAGGSHSGPWGCSLFAALADPAAGIFGRNFDWQFSPALLLFADPHDGYASAAMVDIAYLGVDGSADLSSQPIGDLMKLLDAPYIPFDGLNSAGLVIGMAAVPRGDIADDPNKETVGSLGAIRVMLDKAATVEEALGLLFSYNIDFEGGPPVHYLIADAHGDSVLVEYYDGEIHTFPSETSWHQATNFLVAAADSSAGQCGRYDAISAELEAQQGDLDLDEALGLLADVAQSTTQWSVVYGLHSGAIRVAMGRDFDTLHVLELEMAGP